MTLIGFVSFFGFLSITAALTCHFGVNAPRPKFMADCKCGQHCVNFFFSGNVWSSCGCTIESDGKEHDVCASPSSRFACCVGDACNGQLKLESALPPSPRNFDFAGLFNFPSTINNAPNFPQTFSSFPSQGFPSSPFFFPSSPNNNFQNTVVSNVNTNFNSG